MGVRIEWDPPKQRSLKGVAVMEREQDREGDTRDVLDNPEWDEADIRAGRTLADFEPTLAANIGRAIGRSVRSGKRVDVRAMPEQQGDA